jgi:hypothetical protein
MIAWFTLTFAQPFLDASPLNGWCSWWHSAQGRCSIGGDVGNLLTKANKPWKGGASSLLAPRVGTKKKTTYRLSSSVPPQVVPVSLCVPGQPDFCTSVVWLRLSKNVAFTDSLKMMRQYRALDLLNTLYMCYLQRKHNITTWECQVNFKLSARYLRRFQIFGAR